MGRPCTIDRLNSDPQKRREADVWIRNNMRLAHWVVRRMQGWSFGWAADPDFLLSAAMYGLWKGYLTYDPSRGQNLAGWCTWVALRVTKGTIDNEIGKDKRRGHRRNLSLNDTCGDHDRSWSLSAPPDPDLGVKELHQRLREALPRLLDKREVKILQLRYEDELTLKEIGKKVGLTRERVRQILLDIHRKVEKHLDTDRRIHNWELGDLNEQRSWKGRLIQARRSEEMGRKLEEDLPDNPWPD